MVSVRLRDDAGEAVEGVTLRGFARSDTSNTLDTPNGRVPPASEMNWQRRLIRLAIENGLGDVGYKVHFDVDLEGEHMHVPVRVRADPQ